MKGDQLPLFNPKKIGRDGIDREFDKLVEKGCHRLEQIVSEGRCKDMVEGKPKTFGDLKTPQFDVDEYVKTVELLDQPIVVDDFMMLEGNKGPYATVKAHFPKGKATIGFSCGGVVVMKKLQQAKEADALPLPGKIVKVPGKDYYDIIGPDDELTEQ